MTDPEQSTLLIASRSYRHAWVNLLRSSLVPSALAFQRLPLWSCHFILITALVIVCPACQGLRQAGILPSTASLEEARQAWQVMQRERPGSMPAQRALGIYNKSVSNLVQSLHGREKAFQGGQEIWSGGARSWRVTFDVQAGNGSARTLALSEFDHCLLASTVQLQGFDRVIAHDGLGVPVVLVQDRSLSITRPFHPPHGEFLSATAVLDFPEVVPGHPTEARLRFYNPLKVSALTVGQNARPLAENLTAALQLSLTDAIFDEEGPHQSGQSGPSASGEKVSQLFFPNRYDPTKVPVVFVHGITSDPSVWKNSINELFAEPELRRRYQPACFIYPTKLPIPASAARLRELLQRSRDSLDPGHHDAGFGRMVLVGHSMGGLLVRLQVIDSGTDFWRAFFTATPQEMAGQVDAKTQRMLQKSLFFQREPDVKLAVFIGTPHRGSALADFDIVRAVGRLLLLLPKTAANRMQALTDLPPDYINPTLRSFHDWGLKGTENLSTKHPFFRALAQHPVAVPFHSIIATGNAPDVRTSSDGAVPYSSAHLEGARSEILVPYSHECLEKPGTVQAVMKILKDTK